MNKKFLSLTMAGIISVSTVFQALPINSFAYNSYERIAGKNRYLTSEYVSRRNNSEIVVLASGEKFPDALSAVNISNKYDAATILTDGRSYDIINILKSRNAKKVFLMGGVSSISADLENKIKNEGFDVERISGINRYETSEKAVKKAGYSEVGVASGSNYTDALSASALLKQENCGLLLVDGDKGYKTPEGVAVKYTFGGSRTIPQNGGERIYGVSRFETAIKISNKVKNPRTMAVVSGDNFADALSATNLVVSDDAIIMPVQKYPYYDVIRKAREVNQVIFVGGVNSVSDETASRIIEKGVTPTTKPSAGEDFNTSDLTEEQKQLLKDMEELGNKIEDDIEEIQRIVDKIKELKPQISNSMETIKKIIDFIKNLNKPGNINNAVTSIEKLEKLLETISKEMPSSEQLKTQLTQLKASIEKIKSEIKQYQKILNTILGKPGDKVLNLIADKISAEISKNINNLIINILKGLIGK